MTVEGSVAALPVLHAPAENGLTDLQDRFVDEFIRLGGKSHDAALAAGYGEGGAENMGIRNLARPKVQAEIMRRLKLQGGSALAIALGALFKVIEDNEDPRATVSAALGIMDRFGMAPPKGPAVAVQVNTMGADAVQALIRSIHDGRSRRLSDETGA